MYWSPPVVHQPCKWAGKWVCDDELMHPHLLTCGRCERRLSLAEPHFLQRAEYLSLASKVLSWQWCTKTHMTSQCRVTAQAGFQWHPQFDHEEEDKLPQINLFSILTYKTISLLDKIHSLLREKDEDHDWSSNLVSFWRKALQRD